MPAFLIGAGAAFFFDAQLGKGRRSLARDRSAAFVRRLRRVGTGKLKLVGGHARGFRALLRRLGVREVTSELAVVEG